MQTKQQLIEAVQRKLNLSKQALKEGNVRVAVLLREQANKLAQQN